MSKRVRIVVGRPEGEGGKGGIDRLMDSASQWLRAQPIQGVDIEFIVTRGGGTLMDAPLVFAKAVAALCQRLIRREVDALHLNVASRGSTIRKLVLSGLAHICGVPTILHLHGGQYREFWRGRSKFVKALIRNMFMRAATVVVLGTVWKDFVRDEIGVPATRISVLPNASITNLSAGKPARPVKHIIYLGRLGDQKGTPELVRALAALQDRSDWRATIAGDGDVLRTKSEVGGLGLSERVQITDWLGSEQVEDLLQDADILALPSYHENLPISIIEGLGHGLCVIATAVGAVEDIIKHEQTGLLIRPGDEIALTASLHRVLDDGEFRRKLGEAGQKFHQQNLSLDRFMEKLIAIWRSAASPQAE